MQTTKIIYRIVRRADFCDDSQSVRCSERKIGCVVPSPGTATGYSSPRVHALRSGKRLAELQSVPHEDADAFLTYLKRPATAVRLLHPKPATPEVPARSFSCNCCGRPFACEIQLLNHRCGSDVAPSDTIVVAANNIEVPSSRSTIDVEKKNKKRRRSTAAEPKPQLQGEQRFSCRLCDKDFSTRQYMQMHVNAVHLKVKGYRCRFCGAAFGHQSSLHRHVKLRHNDA